MDVDIPDGADEFVYYDLKKGGRLYISNLFDDKVELGAYDLVFNMTDGRDYSVFESMLIVREEFIFIPPEAENSTANETDTNNTTEVKSAEEILDLLSRWRKQVRERAEKKI